MSYPTSQFTPVLNTSQTITPPNVKEPALTLVLYNQSPFILQLSIGPMSTFMPAFTADAFPVGGFSQPISFTPISGTSTNPPLNRVFGVFYLPGEALPFGAFPASLSGGPSPDDIAVSVANQAFATLANTLLNTGSRIIDQPFVAARQAMTSGQELAAFLNVQASLFQSYVLKFNFSNGAQTSTNYALVEIRFYDDANNIIWRDIIEINANNQDTYVTDRMHGNIMKLFPTFPGGTLNVDWIMSNRPSDRLKVLEAPSGADRILVQDQQVTVAAGATSGHLFVPLFHGPGHWFSLFSAPQTCLVRVFWGSLTTTESQRFQSVNGADISQDILLPLRPLHYTVNNQSGASVTVHTTITARDN